MIRFSPPEPELEQPKGAMPTARPIRNKHLGSQRIVEYLRKASAHQEMLEANKTRAVSNENTRKNCRSKQYVFLSGEW